MAARGRRAVAAWTLYLQLQESDQARWHMKLYYSRSFHGMAERHCHVFSLKTWLIFALHEFFSKIRPRKKSLVKIINVSRCDRQNKRVGSGLIKGNDFG
ncbi:hypothetical protein BDDG_12123 [Blastomyces dermatitidis ATCC 18188]|uniref:Uncharacterized protein n=1 Tax=Ajellomyces dermatitidis (strain ATCC 18188 / CBS 674.68) TaxID=653446 RepID=A0A0J9EM89_AJEDA|nr:hypothetical protein BDDG_12123 [Blastomyces dermatitidis ATCC 18188]